MKSTAATLYFTELLLALLKGKTGLLDALHILAREGNETRVRDSAMALHVAMKNGKGFSESLGAMRAGWVFFEPLYLALIAASEVTGNIENVMEHISGDLKRRQWARENAVSMLIYPALIVLLALAGTIAIFVKVMPFFVSGGLLSADVVKDANGGAAAAGLVLLLGGGALLISYFNIFKNDSPESRIFYLLDFQMKNNVPLLDALSQCVMNLGHTRYGGALVRIKKDVASGVSFSAAFAGTCCFPAYVLGWLSVADMNGCLIEVCGSIKDFYFQKDKRKRETAAKLIEPAVIILIGLYVLILMVTVILPMLSYTGGVL